LAARGLSFREAFGHDEVTILLGGFRWVLQSDRYGAYAGHERKTEGIVRVGCWAHARRKFHEALEERPKAANLVLRRKRLAGDPLSRR
jgi:hypothetical protein